MGSLPAGRARLGSAAVSVLVAGPVRMYECILKDEHVEMRSSRT